MKKCIVLLFVAAFVGSGNAQIDNVLWAGTQIRKQIDQDWSFQFQPIFRYNNDFSTHQNYSFDFSIRRKLNANWFGQVVSRTWIVPDVRDRQFLWIDIGNTTKMTDLKLSMTNRLRWHHAFDFSDRQDPNYLRYLFQLIPMTDWKLKPSFALEYWSQLGNIENKIKGRMIPGLRYKFDKKFGLNVLWMIQYIESNQVDTHQNLWVVAVVYNI